MSIYNNQRRTPIYINSIPTPHVRDQTLGSYRATQILAQIYPRLTPRQRRRARRLFLQTTFGNAPAASEARPGSQPTQVTHGNNYQLTSSAPPRHRSSQPNRSIQTTQRRRSSPQILSHRQSTPDLNQPSALQRPRLARIRSSVFDEDPSSSSSSDEADQVAGSSLSTNNHGQYVDSDRWYLDAVESASYRLLQINIMTLNDPIPEPTGIPMGTSGTPQWVVEWQSIRGMSQDAAEQEFGEYMRQLFMVQYQQQVQLQLQQQQQRQQQQVMVEPDGGALRPMNSARSECPGNSRNHSYR